jgi:GNAT superfamily N-acetyltransferase
MRFMTPKKRLSAAELRYLTEIDHHNHLAFIALDPTAPEDPGLAVARCVRLGNEPAAAEAAITVIDSHQGKGLGRLLLRVLAAAAATRGIETFRAHVLAENAATLHILARMGAVRRSSTGGAVTLEIRLSRGEKRTAPARGTVPKPVARRILPKALKPFRDA